MARRSRSSGRAPRGGRRSSRTLWLGLGLFAVFLLLLCSISGVWWLARWLTGGPEEVGSATPAPTWPQDSPVLTVAVSPVMLPTLQDLAAEFNAQELTAPDGQALEVQVRALVPETMVEMALEAPYFQALVPDSSIWLDLLDRQWAQRHGPQENTNALAALIPPRRVAANVRFAVSPLVIAAWEDVAQELGWPQQPVSWSTVQRKAVEDPAFRWSHPSTQHAAGLLATLAEFYAGAGLTRGLDEDLATQPHVLDYVRTIEATVQFYGESEDVLIRRLEEEGPQIVDAFVAQEQTVIAWNRRQPDRRLVAIYPAEGTLWVDHPLALLELGAGDEPQVTDNQRRTFQAFSEFLTRPDTQRRLLDLGYRPTHPDVALDEPGSPFVGTDAVDPRQPATTLQIPPAPVVEVVRNVWWYTKRPTNVFLVVDTSDSMYGDKLDATRQALRAFVDQIRGPRDRVGLVDFGSEVKRVVPLQPMDEEGREALLRIIDSLEADGYTALVDGVMAAYQALQEANDPEAINAIVVMTDGQENNSRYYMVDLAQAMEAGRIPVLIFTIGFGEDADEELLRQMAELGGGQFRWASEADIQQLYRIISTYF